jgi:uncharacterized protein YktB (UPF0637 family)
MRFLIHKKQDIKSGLRFDFYDGVHDNTDIISILEEDIFTIEPVFYSVISNYNNYGHWGKHLLDKAQIVRLIKELDSYALYLQEKKEEEYIVNLNLKNFKKTLKDIKKNRKSVLKLINSFTSWLRNLKNDQITIHGI